MKVAVVANEVAGNALHAGIGEGGDERFEHRINIIVMQARIHGRITSAENDQITIQNAGSRLGCGVKRGFDAIVHAQTVEREGYGIKFRIRSWAKQLL